MLCPNDIVVTFVTFKNDRLLDQNIFILPPYSIPFWNGQVLCCYSCKIYETLHGKSTELYPTLPYICVMLDLLVVTQLQSCET